ncbi:hypothetical protein AMTRI_Chr02g266650 [Amborella trichopoda]
MSALKIFRKNGSKSSQTQEGNENRLENLCASSTALPPARPPLNLIPDPSQNPNPSSKFVSEKVTDQRPRLEVTPLRNHEKTCEESESQGTVHGNGSMHCTTPRSILGKGSMGSHSEPSSAQSTPTRNISRVFNHGSYGAYTCARLPQSSVGKGGGPSKAMRGLPILASSNLVQVPHFDLTEDPSFWTNHNVQVLIRIRPVSNKERSLQGYTRCLRQESAQTVTWLGHPEARFTFDHVACETITQEKLFKVAGLPMVENCMFGYNSCIFAYGQTGSGKTYTMMGEINDLEDELSEDCGMTPRIFEYLFAQIRAEEESRRDVKLNYVCKCSFLEIYNEQITDLLEPSSTNLQLREDAKKGVYVENLSEFEVRTVKDVLDLLVQGSANRKVASTNMNSESSRSHSVFTCAIESRWEADAMNHLRFGRLNLVDLAGSERQKNSGAEGERLKEAANINKSLSTLGLVIMTLVDVAQGRQRHVPYRDSRLTFLLQDSLGGNSKTAIIANISPSICCVNETLSTLKFAQRAKLIQNNAIVNEDASGDITALQRQIQQLKEEVTFLKHENISRSLPFRSSISGHFICSTGFAEYDSGQANDASGMIHGPVNYVDNLTANNLGLLSKKMKSIEATLAGSLRREKMAEIANNQLEAEIELMNRLIREREDEVYRSKTMLKFQEEKTRRLESFVGGTKPADDYLLEENNALYEEIQLLQGKIDSNPELTWFELENKRLLEQLRLFQDFYEEGEREIMHAEVSELRDQLCEVIEGKLVQNNCPTRTTLQLNLAAATEENVSLTMKADATLQELEDCKKNLGACLESNMRLTREVDDLHNQMKKYLKCKEPMLQKVEHSLFEFGDRTAEKLQENSVQLVLEEDILVENEFTLLHHEVDSLAANDPLYANHLTLLRRENQKLQERLCVLAKENARLSQVLRDREEDTHKLNEEWEEVTIDLAKYLVDGYQALGVVSDQVESISNTYPWGHARIVEQVEFSCGTLAENNTSVECLQKELENAQREGLNMKDKLASLKEAALAIIDAQKLENDEKNQEIIRLRSLLYEKDSLVYELEKMIKLGNARLIDAELCASAASGALKRLSEMSLIQHEVNEPVVEGSPSTATHCHHSEVNEANLQIHSHKLTKVGSQHRTLNVISTELAKADKKLAELKLHINEFSICLKKYVIVGWKAKASEKSNLNPRYSFFDHVSCDNPSDNLLEVSSNVRERKSDMFGDEYHESVETLTIEDQESHKDNDSNCNARFLEKADFNEVVDNVMSNDAGIFHLKKEIDSSIMSLRNIHVLLNGMSDNEEPREPYEQKEYYNDVVNSNTENRQAEMDHKDEQHKLAMLEMEHKLQTFEDWIEKAEAEWRKTRELLHLEHIDAELVAAEKSDLVKSLLMKFEEAHETMKEADWLLNALMKENESAKHEAYQLKKVGEGLMAERTSLIADVQSLKSSICLKEDQYKILQDQVNSNILEIKGSISSLELSLTQVQGDIKDTFMKVWYEICSFGKDILDYFGTVDSWQVDILSEIIERSFYLYVVHQCYIESFHEKLNSSNVNAHFYQHVRRESDITAANLSVAHLKIKGAIGKNDGTSGIEKEAEFELSKCKASRSADIEKKLDMVNTVGVSNGNFVDFDAAFCPKQELSLHLRLEKIEKLEEEKLALTQDIRKLKQGIYRQLADIDRIRDDLAKHKTFSDSVVCLNGHDNLNMNTVMTRLSGLGTEELILSDDQCLDCTRILNGIEPCHLQFQNYGMDSRRSVNRGIEKDIAGTIMDVNSWCIKIQNIKRQCSGFLAPAKENEEGMYESYPQMAHKGSNKGDIQNNIAMFGLEEEVGPQDLVEMNTESVCDSIQAMEILREKFTYLKDNVPSIKPVENESTDASLEMLLQRISIIEEKLFKYISVCSKLQRIKISAISDNLSLKRELDRKDELLKGLLFDISLLQESASEAKDQKDELEGARDALNCAQNELAANTAELDGIMVQYRKVEVQLANKETVVCSLKLELDQANKTLELIADENIQLKDIFEELYAEKSAAEVELEEKSKVIEGLEKEISNLDSSAGQGAFQSFLGIKNELKHFSNERDHLRAQVVRLNGQLDMAKALADENEAIAIEARELSEASKAYAEEKEEEAKILEHSVEELESTVNVLEKKVYEMAEEVERQRLSREHLEFELQSLRHKFSVEQEATGSLYLENPVIVERKDAQFSRHTEEGELELHEARRCIQALEKEKLDRENEIRQCKDYISELVLHAEAQALQYQQKYKNLEAMAREVQTDSVPLIGAMTGSRMEKASARTRGSGSPFKCISALVHQMNSEKDQELSLARHRIEELEGLAALRQKEICMLSARLAAAESMTHDVIRDLLGVKLDMTNYANVLDQQLVQKLAEKAQEHYEGFQAEENFKLREQINDLIKKKDSWAEETNQIQAELLAAKVTAEQLRQRGLMLTAQNEMLKMDKEKLKRRLSELEASSKRIPGSRKPSQQTQ